MLQIRLVPLLALLGLPLLCAADDDSSGAVLRFTIGMHIEPLGVTAQGLTAGRPGGPGYQNPGLFARHVEDIQTVARIVEKHGGRMTIQAQSPFTSVAIQQQDPVLADLAARGHEIALHFHEDAHLGPNTSAVPVETWCEVMRQEVSLIRQASGVERIRYWSGGNLYPDLYKAAACAGLDVNSDWKDPRSQTTPLAILGVNPWRPAGGTEGTDLTLFARHDPGGPVVFLPEGQYDATDFAAMRRSEIAGGDAAYFDYLKRMLLASVEAAQPDKVNVFHFTIHPGEFRGNPETPFAVIEQFLTEAVDPLVASGKVRWATFSEMADAFAEWERAHPGADPRAARPPVQAPSTRGWITFAINAHDWTHAGESAETLTRLVDLFERYQVRGDFYFTPELTRKLAEEHPHVIERLRNSNMTISYHVRPPHPVYPGFDQRLRNLDDAALWQTLLDYETYALDPATGELDRSRPGGYRYVAEVFGRLPVVASAPSNDPRIRNTAERVYASLGAQVTVRYHEEGTRIDQPFEYINELLIRPSDFSITRVNLPGGGQNFWWNLILLPDGDLYRPVRLLEQQLAAWEERKPGRPPLITALIHENNFERRGPEGWSSIYFTIVNGQRGDPLPPPYDLNAPDPSVPRPAGEKAAIWNAYEELLAWAARELTVVTSEDLVKLARTGLGAPPPPGGDAPPPGFDPAKAGTTERNLAYCGGGEGRLLMDVYYPRSADRRWPALVFVHGGGWTGGDKSQGGPETPALRDAGFLVASVNYRLAPQFRFPAMIEDVKCAVRFLRANAAGFNIDPDRIGAWGSSAGGHLASLLGTADAAAGFDVGPHPVYSSRVQAVVSLFGPADLTVPFAGGYEGRSHIFGSFDAALASPVTYVSPDDPPFLLVHGDSDPLVPLSQSEIFLERLKNAGVPAELIVVRNAGHGLTPVNGQAISPSRPEITQRIAEFFRKHLAGE